jgi:PAS domain S-box-containing protein
LYRNLQQRKEEVLNLNTELEKVNLDLERDITARKKVENALREGEEQYRLLFLANPNPMFVFDEETLRFLAVNDAAVVHYGWSREEFLAMTILDIRLPEEKARALEIIKQHQGKYESRLGMIHHLGKDGISMDMEITTSSVRFQGRPGRLCLMNDVTERNKVETAWHQSEERLRFALESNHTGAWDLDLLDHTTFRSPEHDRIFGYPELLSKWTYEMFLDHVLPEDRDSVNAKFKRAIETQGDWNFECRVRRVDGVVRWIWAVGRHQADGAGTPRRMSGVVQDITERKQAEEALRDSEARFRAVLDNSRDVIVRFNLESGRYEYVSQSVEALVGYSPEQFKNMDGQTALAMIHPDDRAVLQTAQTLSMNDGKAEAEYRQRARNGDWIWISNHMSVVKDSTGKPLYRTSNIRDITELKKAESALQQYTRELEFANNELESFSYSVSHDLKAPLRALDGFSEAVLSEYGDKLDKTGKDYLKRVRKASQSMGQLIDAILKLSRVGRAEMYEEKVNLSDMAHSIVEELKASQPGRQAEFIITPGIRVNGDIQLLRILLQNLLENAWKFTAKCQVASIELGVNEKNGERVYFIKDNGVGFDMKYAAKLFQPFQRLHPNSEFSGTGIGLATVQRVVHRHRGSIWPQSEIGKGTTFYFTLGRL